MSGTAGGPSERIPPIPIAGRILSDDRGKGGRMDHYIIFTANIHPIGGMQTYVAGKAKFLEARGWKVDIFFSGRDNIGGCAIKSLDKYTAGWFPEISIPPGNWPAFMRKTALREMCEQIGDTEGKIIIESQASAYALWGELLAEKLKAKHFCFICNETFRGKDRFYEEYLGFFDFKHGRGELAGINTTSLSRLFEGYKCVAPEENYTFAAAYEGPVQDVENDAVNRLERADWNICYIGRIEKGYVPEIIKGVYDFSQVHPDKTIQFIFVGNEKKRLELILQTFAEAENVKLTFLGNCVPIPRMLYSKVDVVIAGSGCAMVSAREDALTILADSKDFTTNGVLGIDTFDTLYCESGKKQMSYQEALEKILILHEYEDKEIRVDRGRPCEEYYAEHFDLIAASDQDIEHYDVVKGRKNSHKLKWALYRIDWMVKIFYRKNVSSRQK